MRWTPSLGQNRGYNNIKYNLFFTFVIIILSVAALLLGYQLGGIKGLSTGLFISIVIWLLSPFVKDIVVEK